MQRHRVVGALLALLFMGGSAGKAQATFPGENGPIGFLEAGSAAVTELDSPFFTRPLPEYGTGAPAYNAQGTRIALDVETRLPDCHGDDCQRVDIRVMNADGTGSQTITSTDEPDRYPAWNPAGTLIVYSTEQAIKTVNPATGAIHTLRDLGAGRCCLREPDWSPDGSKIAYTEDPGAAARIRVMNADGSGDATLVAGSPTQGDAAPSWSPDGSRVAFRTYNSTTFQPIGIYTTSLANPQRDLLYSGSSAPPVFSPDGTRVVFNRGTFPNTGLFTIPASGGPFVAADATRLPVMPETNHEISSVGSWAAVTPLSSVEDDVDAGGTVMTDPEDPAPVAVAVTTPNAGTVRIARASPLTVAPEGLSLLGNEFRIDAPDASVEAPLLLEFTLDAAAVPGGETAETLEILRNGQRVEACVGPTIADPDPCVASRQTLAGGTSG